MRTSIATLLVLFGLLFFAHSAEAQSSPMTSQLLQQAPQKSPTSAKLLAPPRPTQITLLPKQDGSDNDPAITPQELRTWIQTHQNRKDRLPIIIMRSGGGLDAPNCAHIRIIQAPDMDSEMVVQMSPGDGGPITTFQGLPPCRRDLPTPMAAQLFRGVPPESRFRRAGRSFIL